MKNEENSNNQPLFSIIIPEKNSEEYIFNTLNSISNQSYQNFELLIIDDNSSQEDKSKVIIEDWKKQHNYIDTKLFQTEENSRGPGGARNIGLDNAKGQYIVFLDSDDELKPDALINIENAIQNNPNTDIFVLGYQLTRLDKNENKVCSISGKPGKLEESRFYQIGVNTAGQIWNTCIKKTLFDSRNGKSQIRFKSNCIFEDLPTKIQLFTRTKQDIKSVRHITHTQYSRPCKSLTGTLKLKDMTRLIDANKEIANLKNEVDSQKDKMYINIRMALVPVVLSWFVSKCIRNKIDMKKNIIFEDELCK